MHVRDVAGAASHWGGWFSFAVFLQWGWGPKCPYEAVAHDESLRGSAGLPLPSCTWRQQQAPVFDRVALPSDRHRIHCTVMLLIFL